MKEQRLVCLFITIILFPPVCIYTALVREAARNMRRHRSEQGGAKSQITKDGVCALPTYPKSQLALQPNFYIYFV